MFHREREKKLENLSLWVKISMIIYSKEELLFNENKETQFTLLDFWRLRELKTYCFTWSITLYKLYSPAYLGLF